MTDPLGSAIPSGAALAALTPESRPKNAAEAASQFEALLLGQMLRSIREAASPEDDGDSSSATMLDIADQQVANLLAHNGGLGLARLIVTGLDAPGPKSPAPPARPGV